MNSVLQAHMVDLHLQDLQHAAERARRARIEPDVDTADGHDCVWVRLATGADASALRELAQLESQPVPSGPALVAEVDGRVLAALPLRNGRALADPFRRTADLVALLELRAAQLDWVEARPALRSRVASRLRGRPSAFARTS